MANLFSVVFMMLAFYNVGFCLENAASYQMDVIDSSKLVGNLIENFVKEAQTLEQEFSSLTSTKIAHKENCDGSYTEILNRIALLATKLNTSVSVELQENWASNTHVVLDHDGRVIYLAKNDSATTSNEKIPDLENPVNYTKELNFKLNGKLSVKIGIFENDSQNFVKSKSIFSYLMNDVLLEFLSNIWFVMKVVLVICTIYVMEML